MADTEAIDAIWEADLLDRKKEAAFLESFLFSTVTATTATHDRRSLVINVKASWGSGKTFFLNRFAEQLRLGGHKVAQLDAWRADPEIDPLVSLVAAIRKEILPELRKKGAVANAFAVATQAGETLVLHTLKSVASKVVKKVAGVEFDKLAEIAADALSESPLEDAVDIDSAKDILKESVSEAADNIDLSLAVSSYFMNEVKKVGQQKSAVEKFTKSVETIASKLAARKGGKAPFYVVIDELDRCRPTFAIQLLERINHLFDTEGLVFVIGTDSDELEHSIRAVYGAGFDSRSYLNRFFSYTYNMAEPEIDNWLKYLIVRYDIDLQRHFLVPQYNDAMRLLKTIGTSVKLTTRDYLHVFFLIQTVQNNWQHQSKIDLIALYVLAITVFLKEDMYLAETHLRPEQHNSRTAIAMGKVKIDIQNRNGPSAVTVNKYMHDILTQANTLATKALNKNQEDGGSTLNHHLAQILISQLAGRDTKSIAQEKPLWGRYYSILQTASQVALPDSENH